ncbi:extracellular solute-binding protein [Paenibacillus macerans]|nr:extracellular solute-binding protein [Paenibacillus macerans]MBS5912188.1 extracellular solute-binding protein [Paenibacillus macerans]MCY7561313.1 extracellular solute-binding protein [Paenibacillus macerans]MEC0149973.1 extracellular solute-binding protein [Paenibacillus macerans]MUG21586.1 extracellular solute-binding protein [Paenibacillus macerans]UMV46213.1 extracellular solute-binding protein [Paenibacillus macerans]
MRTKNSSVWLKGLSVIVLASLMLAACSGGGGDGANGDPGGASKDNQNQASAADDGPLGKYDPAIEVSFVRDLSDVVENNVLGVLKGETIDNNRWTQLYEDELGIKIKYDWVVKGSPTSDQYLQKINVTLASGDLPDVIPVNATQLKQLADSDQIEDMTELYEKYASPFTKKVLSEEGTSVFDAATFDGKLMAVPQLESSMERAMYIWIRTDWLDKLGLKPPKTMADVLAISKAFTEGDPDGNGKKDTFGLGVTKDLWGGAMGLEGFMAGYDAYPNIWVEDASGKLVFGSTQPEVKKALQVLQDMAKNGQIDQEFGVKDGGKVSEQISAGKIGMEYGEQWNSIWPLQLNRDNDPNAQWQAFPIVSESGETPKVPLKFSTTRFFAVKKGAAHPEAVIKMFNLHLEKNWGETAEFDKYFAPPEAESVWQLSPVTPYPVKKNVDAFRAIDAARKAGDFSTLTGEAKTIQEKLEAYASGSSDGFALWGWERIYGEEGSMGIADHYDKNNQFLREKFVGAPTPTMVERKATLEKLQNEVFVKIILGDPIDKFDQFVADWKKLGGDQITQEVNEWYETTK